MKREEVKEHFPEATDEQIDGILNKFAEELNPVKKQLKEAQGELETTKSALEASQQSEAKTKVQLDELQSKLEEDMSVEERIAAREKAADERERDFQLKSNALDARELFVAAGCFDEDDISGLVEQVTCEDVEKTKTAAQRIVDAVSKQREAADKAAKAALLKDNPKPGDPGDDGATGPKTRKEFLELPYEKQLALKEADPDILSRLS